MISTWKRKSATVLLGLCLVGSTALATPAPAKQQIETLAKTGIGAGGWFVEPADDVSWEKWCYAVTDLNHDGNLEIFKAKHGGDNAPAIQCEELNEGQSSRHWGLFLAGGTDIPDILSDDEPNRPRVFHDIEENKYAYVFTEKKRHSEFDAVTRQYAISLNKDLLIEELAFRVWQLSGYDGSETNHYYQPGWLKAEAEGETPPPPPTEITEAEYQSMATNRFPTMMEETGFIKWMDAKELYHGLHTGNGYNLLKDSYNVFSMGHGFGHEHS